MKLGTFLYNGRSFVGVVAGPGSEAGAEPGSRVIHLNAAYRARLAAEGEPCAGRLADALVPDDMVAFLEGGSRSLEAAAQAVEFAMTMTGETGIIHSMDELRTLAPVARPGKIICIGLNYRDHAAEIGADLPGEPVLFSKFANAVIGPGEPIIIPPVTKQVDYEAELAVVIGKRGRDIPADRAMDHIAGYTAFNDVSARDLQFRDGQWIKGKTLDTFAPMGPYLITSDEVPDPENLAIRLHLNGVVMQDSSTSQLIFGVRQLIAYLSSLMTLEPGDIIATGTPSGVGFKRKPPVFLEDGDVVTVEIERVGTLTNPVRNSARRLFS
ncbi:MAG TPA: fumarylacetoacetate hydrolase family protein [Firmicutes bacterium]|nr:fumarylacetoacetate hydrolase family protein [Bacillota bacterium]